MKKLFNQRKRPYREEVDRNDWENYYEELGEETEKEEEVSDDGEEIELVYADAVTDYEEISDMYDAEETESEEDYGEAEESGEVEYESVEEGEPEDGIDEEVAYEGDGPEEDLYGIDGEEEIFYGDDGDEETVYAEEYGDGYYIDDSESVETDLGEYQEEYQEEEYQEEEYREEEYQEEYQEEEAGGDQEYIYTEADGEPVEEEDFSFEDDTRFDFDLYEDEKENAAAAPHRMGLVDKMVAFTGVLVLLAAIATGAFYLRMRAEESQLAGLGKVGSSLENIELPGQTGLLAVAQAEATKKAEAEFLLAQRQQEQQEPDVLTKPSSEYEEEEYTNKTTVALNLSSIEKDLKIKFINKESGKLISNVPFNVSVAGTGGNLELSDDDMDGVIYKSNITPGTYTVLASALSDNKYKDYDLPDSGQKVEVKAEIVYEKVDVADEVKTEAEVDVSKEDTAMHEIVVEEQLSDTVGWVDSTITASGFKEVERQTIVDPATTEIAAANANAAPAAAPGVTSVAAPSEAGTVNLNASQLTMTVGAAFGLTAAGNEAISLTEIVWSSSDANVAVVDADGTVTGVAAGTAVITCQASGLQVSGGDALPDLSASCTVVVETLPAQYDPRNDTENRLKDFAGNQVYVQENGGYREAFFADYYTAEKFYIKEDAKYTGWQTINGNVYYFDANGNKVTGEQVIEGARYTFSDEGILLTGTSTRGIDVSRYNGDIDWQAVKNSGMEYVIIRCGFRGYSTGKMVEDSKFKENIQGAASVGLKVGVYFVTQAVSAAEAVEEASMVLDQISGYQLAYPVFLDVEPSGGKGRADNISKETRTAVCKAFCETIHGSGYTAGIYANKTWLTEKIDTGSLGAYKIWLAQYAAEPTYTGRYDLWQYQQTGRVSGIEGDVDMNWSYLGY